MAQMKVTAESRRIKQWITVNGKHIPIFEGETKEDAVKRATNKKVAEDGVKVAKSFQSKYSNQIDKDNDEKEKQIKQNEEARKVAKQGSDLFRPSKRSKNKEQMKSEIENLKTDKQVLKYLKEHNIPVIKNNSDEHNGKLSIWIDDKTRIYKSARGYVVQGWRVVDMTPSNIPTFDPSWQASKRKK